MANFFFGPSTSFINWLTFYSNIQNILLFGKYGHSVLFLTEQDGVPIFFLSVNFLHWLIITFIRVSKYFLFQQFWNLCLLSDCHFSKKLKYSCLPFFKIKDKSVSKIFALTYWHFFKLSEKESHSVKDLHVQKRTKSVTLVEDDLLFTLSSDDEFLDAEETDRKYEKQKLGNKLKAKHCKKSSKKKKKQKANIPLSDNEGGESEEEEGDDFLFSLSSDDEVDDFVEEEKDETEATFTPKPKSNIGENKEAKFRAKNTVFNKSQLTGW